MKPYRPNVGIALFNRDGHVLIGRRIEDDGPEIILTGLEWQMPQGGIDAGEDPSQAARRELQEETAVARATILAVMPGWLTYDFPSYRGPPHRLDYFRGQRQLWFAMRFDGDDEEIDVARRAGDGPAEFSTWRWERLEDVTDLVVPFRRRVYRAVAREFAPFARPV